MPKDPPKQKKPLPDYAKYSGMGIQMLGTILLGTYAGVKLDEYFGFSSHILTILLSLFSVAIAIYFAVKKIS
jgi:hypothetical protein